MSRPRARFGAGLLAAIMASTMIGGAPALDAAEPDPNNPYLSSSALRLNDDGTVIGSILTGLLNEDDNEKLVDLPFPLNFGGVSYDALCVNSNAYIALAQQTDTCSNAGTYNIPMSWMLEESSGRPVIAAGSADQDLGRYFGLVPSVYDADPAIVARDVIGSLAGTSVLRIQTDFAHGILPGNEIILYCGDDPFSYPNSCFNGLYANDLITAVALDDLLADGRWSSTAGSDLSPLSDDEFIVIRDDDPCWDRAVRLVDPGWEEGTIELVSGDLVIDTKSWTTEQVQPGQCLSVAPVDAAAVGVPLRPVRVTELTELTWTVTPLDDDDAAAAASLTSPVEIGWTPSDCFGANQGVHFGETTVDGRRAIVLTWYRNRWYNALPPLTPTFTSQIVLAERDTADDTNGKNFDIEFNFASITAEHSDWSFGYARCGDQESGLEGLPGDRTGCTNHWVIGLGWGDPNEPSDTVVKSELFPFIESKALLDSDPVAGLIHNSLNTETLGRYTWTVEDGQPINFIPPTMTGGPTYATGTAPTVGAPTAVGSGTSAVVSWPAATPGSSGTIASYTASVVGNPSLSCTVAAPATTCTIPGLSYGVPYQFTVTALTSTNASSPVSEPSEPLTLTEPTTTAPTTAPTTTPTTTVCGAGGSCELPATGSGPLTGLVPLLLLAAGVTLVAAGRRRAPER